jgi:hypothetical protein
MRKITGNIKSNHHFLSGLLLFIILIAATNSYADFASINPFVKHFSNEKFGSAGIIILPEKNQSQTDGVFIYYSEQPIPAQGFNIDKLNKNKSESIFINYDSRVSKKFNEIITSSGDKYNLSGSATIKIGKVLVTLRDDTQPYLSLVLEDYNAAIAMTGLQVIYSGSSNNKGEKHKALAPLNGTTLDIFAVKNGKLNLNGEEYKNSKLGLDINDITTACNSSNVVVFNSDQLELYKKNSKKFQFMKKNYFSKNTLLFSQPDYVLVLDGFGQLQILKQTDTRFLDGGVICLSEMF